jgi:hypothetical protein
LFPALSGDLMSIMEDLGLRQASSPELSFDSLISMKQIELCMRRDLQGKLERLSGMIGEIGRDQHPAVWTTSGSLYHQHRPVSFADDFLRGSTEEQVLDELCPVSADHDKVDPFVSALSNNLDEGRAGKNANSRPATAFSRRRFEFAAELLFDFIDDPWRGSFIGGLARHYVKDCERTSMLLGQL